MPRLNFEHVKALTTFETVKQLNRRFEPKFVSKIKQEIENLLKDSLEQQAMLNGVCIDFHNLNVGEVFSKIPIQL